MGEHVYLQILEGLESIINTIEDAYGSKHFLENLPHEHKLWWYQYFQPIDDQ